MGLYRVEREVQVRCHVEVGEALGEQLEQAHLGVGERVRQPAPVGPVPIELAGLQTGRDQGPEVVGAGVAGRA